MKKNKIKIAKMVLDKKNQQILRLYLRLDRLLTACMFIYDVSGDCVFDIFLVWYMLFVLSLLMLYVRKGFGVDDHCGCVGEHRGQPFCSLM